MRERSERNAQIKGRLVTQRAKVTNRKVVPKGVTFFCSGSEMSITRPNKSE